MFSSSEQLLSRLLWTDCIVKWFDNSSLSHKGPFSNQQACRVIHERDGLPSVFVVKYEPRLPPIKLSIKVKTFYEEESIIYRPTSSYFWSFFFVFVLMLRIHARAYITFYAAFLQFFAFKADNNKQAHLERSTGNGWTEAERLLKRKWAEDYRQLCVRRVIQKEKA